MIHQIKPLLNNTLLVELTRYLTSGGWLTEHKKTEEFEQVLATFLGKKHCIVVPSGTVALALATFALIRTRAADVARDQVFVPDLTMIATANALSMFDMKLTPRFTDVDANMACMHSKHILPIGYNRACGIIYVSLNGRSSDMDEIRRVCDRYNMFFIEDACQSFGSRTPDGRYLGTIGDVGCFSLSPHKIITTGQGGFIVTDIDDVAKEIRSLKDFGRKEKGVDDHISLGFNFKFTDLQAVIGLDQMTNISKRLELKKDIYNKYYTDLHELVTMRPLTVGMVPWFVDIYSDRVVDIQHRLQEAKIGCRRMYPPLHTQHPYCSWGWSENFDNSKKLSATGLWLPSYLEITDEEIQTVCCCIRAVLE